MSGDSALSHTYPCYQLPPTARGIPACVHHTVQCGWYGWVWLHHRHIQTICSSTASGEYRQPCWSEHKEISLGKQEYTVANTHLRIGVNVFPRKSYLHKDTVLIHTNTKKHKTTKNVSWNLYKASVLKPQNLLTVEPRQTTPPQIDS